MDYRLKLPIKVFWNLGRPLIKAWMGFVMRPIVKSSLPKDLVPPYLIISNHVNVYDGLVVTLFSRHLPVPIYDDVQRLNAIYKFIFTKIGVVFKAFGVADPVSIRNMVAARDAKRALLLFPEGEITWTGDSKPLEKNIARLVRRLSIPIVLVKVKGAYTKKPKWAKSFNSGTSIFEFSLLLRPEELAKLDDEQLLELLQSAQGHKELDWISTAEGRSCHLVSTEPAKGLEKLLFCCPKCKSTNCMTTVEPDELTCSHCGYSVEVSSNFALASTGAELPFGDIRSWHEWQKAHWTGVIRDRAASGEDVLKAECPSVKFAAIKGKGAAKIGTGPAILRTDGIHFRHIDGSAAKIPLSEILVCHCYRFAPNQDNRLLIRTSDKFYMLELTEPNSPALSWELAVKSLQ